MHGYNQEWSYPLALPLGPPVASPALWRKAAQEENIMTHRDEGKDVKTVPRWPSALPGQQAKSFFGEGGDFFRRQRPIQNTYVVEYPLKAGACPAVGADVQVRA